MIVSSTVNDLRDKIIVFGIIAGVFLPVRLLFYTYVSQYWLGSVGLVSMLAIIMIVLTKKNKLGWFGQMFVKQMAKTMRGKAGKIAICFSLIFVVYFGGTLVLIERGNTIYLNEKEAIFSILYSSKAIPVNNSPYTDRIILDNERQLVLGTTSLSYFDKIASMTYAILNDLTGGWLVHLHTILLAEQFEVLGILIFFRRIIGNSYKLIDEKQAII